MSEIVYEAAVYERTVKYRNFKGEERTVKLYFALDPIKLMRIIASVELKPNAKSGNPAKRDQPGEFTQEMQLKFITDLASDAAGTPSDDGESWEVFENFSETLAGKAFTTRLASSDADRREFADKVIMNPFRAFVNFAKEDSTNSPKEVAQLEEMLSKMERLFSVEPEKDETLEERRIRLAAELESLGNE